MPHPLRARLAHDAPLARRGHTRLFVKSVLGWSALLPGSWRSGVRAYGGAKKKKGYAGALRRNLLTAGVDRRELHVDGIKTGATWTASRPGPRTSTPSAVASSRPCVGRRSRPVWRWRSSTTRSRRLTTATTRLSVTSRRARASSSRKLGGPRAEALRRAPSSLCFRYDARLVCLGSWLLHALVFRSRL